MVECTSNKEHWSNKYKQASNELRDPVSFIKNNVNYLNKGSLLDLACGDGSNAIFLAKSGFDVTGVDFSDEAIKRLLKFSELHNVSIDTSILDLDNLDDVKELGRFDNIIISKFKPTLEIFKYLHNLLNTSGILLFCSFNYRQSEERGFPRKYCLEQDEFTNVSDDLVLIKHDVLVEEKGHFDGYIFKSKS